MKYSYECIHSYSYVRSLMLRGGVVGINVIHLTLSLFDMLYRLVLGSDPCAFSGCLDALKYRIASATDWTRRGAFGSGTNFFTLFPGCQYQQSGRAQSFSMKSLQTTWSSRGNRCVNSHHSPLWHLRPFMYATHRNNCPLSTSTVWSMPSHPNSCLADDLGNGRCTGWRPFSFRLYPFILTS